MISAWPTLLRSPERDDFTPGVETGVLLLKSGFITSSALLVAGLRGVSKDERDVEEETGLSIISIFVACANNPYPGSQVKYLGFSLFKFPWT